MGNRAFDNSPCHYATLWWRLPCLLCRLHGGLAEEVVDIGHPGDPLAVLENVRLELSSHVGVCVACQRGTRCAVLPRAKGGRRRARYNNPSTVTKACVPFPKDI